MRDVGIIGEQTGSTEIRHFQISLLLFGEGHKLVEVDTVCCENVWVSTRYVIVSYDLQNKLGKYVLCLEGTIKSVGPKGTKELASISGPRLFHILINDLD